MKKCILFFLLVAGLTIGCTSDSQTDKKTKKTSTFAVYDGSIEQDRKTYSRLNLDDTCPNLLDPNISKDEIAKVKAAWFDLNKSLGSFLSENDFNWDTTGTKVNIWHKFYFNKDGTLKAYLFKFRDKSINEKTRASYKKFIKEFGSTYKLPLTKESTFAQCGSGIFAL